MPNIPQQQTIVQYVANSAQTQYTFAFYAPLPTDIQVFYQASTAVPVPAADILLLNTNYTVTYNSDPTTGGYITLLFTPTTGYYLTINRQVAPSLNTNFANAQNFNGANLDAALDRLLLLIQQNFNYITQRNLSYLINTYLPNATPYTQLPPLPQNYFWVGSGSGVVAAQISTVPSASVLQSMLASNSPGTDGARIVGYYDAIHSNPTTVQAYLANLLNSPTINTPNIVGVSNGAAAAAGTVGEIISSVILSGSAISFVNAVTKDLASITLTPGDWDVWGNILFVVTGGGSNNLGAWINSVSASPPDVSLFSLLTLDNFYIANWAFPVPQRPFNVSVTTTYYISGFCAINSGTIAASGGIYARRRH